MINKNNKSNYIDVLKDVCIPIFVFYFVYAVALMGLTSTVTELLKKIIVQGIKNNVRDVTAVQEMTIRTVISGMAMLLGVLPLFPGFKKEIKEREERRPENKNKIYQSIFFTIMLAISGSITINILFMKLHILEASETYQQVSQHQYGVHFLFGIFLYGVVFPFAEEVVFRGIAYNRLKKYFSVKVSILVSAFLFGVYHANLVQGIYGFLMGMLIAYIYEKLGNFFYAFLFHAAANAVVYTVTSFEPLYHALMMPYMGVVLAAFLAGTLVVLSKRKE